MCLFLMVSMVGLRSVVPLVVRSLFCHEVFGVISSSAILLLRKRGLVALLQSNCDCLCNVSFLIVFILELVCDLWSH